MDIHAKGGRARNAVIELVTYVLHSRHVKSVLFVYAVLYSGCIPVGVERRMWRVLLLESLSSGQHGMSLETTYHYHSYLSSF